MSTPSLRWQCVCVDATDPRAIATFWQEALGATRAELGQGDVSWVVLQDPDGHELCVLPALGSQDATYEGA
ncbi:hypothetical protein BH10ACT10_BH10ACT10_16310 [soil metagenome]